MWAEYARHERTYAQEVDGSARTMKMKGQAKEVKGKVKGAVGSVTRNDRMKASGRSDVRKGKGQSALGGAGQKVGKITKNIAGKR